MEKGGWRVDLGVLDGGRGEKVLFFLEKTDGQSCICRFLRARQEPSYSCTISRHGIVQASLTLHIWLIEMAAFSSDVGWSLRRTEIVHTVPPAPERSEE